MAYLIAIGAVSFLASILTFFSGFGLGTILLPVFSVWYPIDVAVALTAIVHLLNNLFKVYLIGSHADWSVVKKFGAPAIAASLLGALMLVKLSDLPPLLSYSLAGKDYAITPLKLSFAIIMIAFSLFESLPKLQNLNLDSKYLPIGGALSGFFGGLSGHQGALRSAFLVRTGLSKESFIATGVVIACLIDLIRLAVYSQRFTDLTINGTWIPIVVSTLMASTGAVVGNRFLKKITMESIRRLVTMGLIIVALLLGLGII